MMNTQDGQRRAAQGGEIGANGEWYRGGTFIATSENTIKSAPGERFQPTPEQLARKAKAAERAASITAWLEARRIELADVIATLTACPFDGIDPAVWAQRVADHAAGFQASLGRTLWAQGCLSRKQAEVAVRAVYGRRTRRIEDAAWDERVEWLMREWAE